MEPVLRLLPHPALRALQDRLLHLVPPVGRETVEKDRLRARQLHQPLGYRIALERRPALLGVTLVTHGSPDIGGDQIGAGHRLLRLFGDAEPGELLVLLEQGAVGLVSFRAGHPELEPQQPGRFHPGVGDVIPIPDPSDDLPLPAAQRFLQGEQVGQHLTGVQQIGEPVDDRHRRPAGQLQRFGMRPGPDDQGRRGTGRAPAPCRASVPPGPAGCPAARESPPTQTA